MASGGIHMSDIPSMPYCRLWQERELVSVSNLSRRDGQKFFPLARAAGVHTRTVAHPLNSVDRALSDLRAGRY